MALVAQNRRARFDYQIQETLEAGIVLTGPEVKSCRKGMINLAGAYVSFMGGRPRIKHVKIAAYPFAKNEGYEPERDRDLLLKKSEVERIQSLSSERGTTIVPLEVHAGKYIKLVLGIAVGRKKADKRSVIREREMGRSIREGREI